MLMITPKPPNAYRPKVKLTDFKSNVGIQAVNSFLSSVPFALAQTNVYREPQWPSVTTIGLNFLRAYSLKTQQKVKCKNH